MHTGCINSVHRAHSRQHRWQHGCCEFMNEFTKTRVFLRRAADHCEWPNGTGSVGDAFHPHDRKIVFQAVISKVIAKWAFGPGFIPVDFPNNTKISLGRHQQPHQLALTIARPMVPDSPPT